MGQTLSACGLIQISKFAMTNNPQTPEHNTHTCIICKLFVFVVLLFYVHGKILGGLRPLKRVHILSPVIDNSYCPS